MSIVVVFAGEYDLASQKELRRELQRLRTEPDVVLDFSEVTYIDSACIGELLLLNRARKELGFERETIILRAENRAVQRIFEVTGLSSVFDIVRSIDGRKDGGTPHVVQYAFSGGGSIEDT